MVSIYSSLHGSHEIFGKHIGAGVERGQTFYFSPSPINVHIVLFCDLD